MPKPTRKPTRTMNRRPTKSMSRKRMSRTIPRPTWPPKGTMTKPPGQAQTTPPLPPRCLPKLGAVFRRGHLECGGKTPLLDETTRLRVQKHAPVRPHQQPQDARPPPETPNPRPQTRNPGQARSRSVKVMIACPGRVWSHPPRTSPTQPLRRRLAGRAVPDPRPIRSSLTYYYALLTRASVLAPMECAGKARAATALSNHPSLALPPPAHPKRGRSRKHRMTTAFGVRRQDAAFGRGDKSPRPKARPQRFLGAMRKILREIFSPACRAVAGRRRRRRPG